MLHVDRAAGLRVLMTADAVGGVWTYAVELARALAECGIRTTLAVLGPQPSPAQQAEAARLADVTLHHCPGRLEWMDDPWTDVAQSAEWLLDLERRAEPDIVHVNGYCHGGLPWRAPVLVAGHSCIRSWWRAVRGGEAPGWVDRYTREVAGGLRAADLVVAPSAAMLASLERDYGPLPRTAVISNGRAASGVRVRKEPFVFAAGRLWDEAKNVAALCDVAPALHWPVFVAGEARGPVFPGSAVHRLGVLPAAEMARWMARASIYAMPARYEPFGLAALEAALAGCALVLGDIGSLREIWGEAATFVRPGDREALRTAIVRLIEDGERRGEMQERARLRAQAFTPQKMASEYLHAYGWLLEHSAACGRTARLEPAAPHAGTGRRRPPVSPPAFGRTHVS